MQTKHKFSQFYISFGPMDWDNGTARQVMDYLKSLPKGTKSYIPTTKEWRVDKTKAPQAISEVFAINNKCVADSKDMDKMEDDFDAVGWLDETFGKKAQPTI